MRAGLLASVLVACSSSSVLPPPSADGVGQWLVVVTEPNGEVRAEVLGELLEIEVTGVEPAVEALGYPMGTFPEGRLAVDPAGVPLPEAILVRRARPSDGAWVAASAPSEGAASLRVPRRDDCTSFLAETRQLVGNTANAVRATLRLDPDHVLLVTNGVWAVADDSTLTPVPEAVKDVQVAAMDPDGRIFVVTSTRVVALVERERTWTASSSWERPSSSALSAAAAPRPGVIYLLTVDGQILRTERSGTRLVYSLGFGPTPHDRGDVKADGDGVIAGMGTDPTFVRLDADDRPRTFTLPDPNEGAVALGRSPELGYVVGTNGGYIRAQSAGFDVIADPLGLLPLGVTVRAVHPVGDRIYFGGNSGVFAERTPRGNLCGTAPKASCSIRFVAEVGRRILVTGVSLDVAPEQLNVTWFEAQ